MKNLTSKKLSCVVLMLAGTSVLGGCEATVSGVSNDTTIAPTTDTGGSGSGGGSGAGGGSGTGGGGTTVTTSDVMRIVSAGPSLSFNALTGGGNDVAINPVTGLPAVVYYDKSSTGSGTAAIGALKYAYMDTTGAWNIEIIDLNYGTAACGAAGSFCVGAPNAAAAATATIMRLAFKSDGTPAVAYVYGASLTTAGTKQIRLAERSTPGAWTASIVFASSASAGATNAANTLTVDALKGVTLNFDSADRPHVTFSFYAQTLIGNSNIMYAFRPTGGSWSTSAISPSITAGTITGLTQGAMQSGAVMCPSNGRLLLASSVVDAAAGSGKALYIRCTALAANGGCSTWNTLNLENGCGTTQSCFSGTITTTTNAATRMDIAIDAATQRPILGIYSTATPATTLLTVTAPLSCEQAQSTANASWGAPVTVAAGSAGLNGFVLASSTSALNTNFISYLNSTTSVMVNKSTGPTGAWLATGTTIETATVGGQGVGMAYNSSADQLYVSYSQLPASAIGAIGNDLIVASGQGADVTSAGAAGSFLLNYIDGMLNAYPTTAVPMFSAAKAANGTVGYAYFFQDSTVGDMKLYYGARGGTTTAPTFGDTFVTNFVESAASPQLVGSYPSLSYDSASNPVIGFYNGVTTIKALQVARSFNGGSTFSVTTVDDVSADVGQYPSVATSGNTIGVAYYDVTNTGLKFARWTASMGWRRFAVDGMTGATCGLVADDAGKYARLAFTSTGQPVIAYQSNGGLKFAFAAEAATSGTYTWNCVSLDSSGNTRGEGIDLVLSSTDTVHIAHFDASAGHVRYVKCSNAASSCSTTGVSAFESEIVGAVGATTSVVTTPSIQLTTAGTVYIAHYSAAFQGLALASKASSASTWSVEYIDANSSGGSYTSLAGQYPVLLMNSSSLPMVFYRSNENWIKYFSREQI